jgi:uncharacterized membrane protein YciS (DUF1049 family)
MIVLIGLVVLVAAVVVGVAGVLANGGSGHAFSGHFAVFGYHVSGSTGELFLYGVVVGAIGVGGLGLLLSGASRTARRGRLARRELKRSRRETASVSKDRDQLAEQQQAATATSDSTTGGSGLPADPAIGGGRSAGRGRHLFGHHAADREPVRNTPGDDQ